MSYVDAPGIVTIQPIFGLNTQPVENTFHYHVTGAINATVLTALGNAYIAWFTAHTGLFSTSLSLDKVYCRDLSTQFGASLDVNPTDSLSGTAAGTVLPNNVSFALKRQSGLAGRANRGRIYHPGITQAACSGTNVLSGGFAADLVIAYNALLAAMIAAGADHEVILHRALGTGTQITGYAWSDLFLDSQRRRLPGHNIHH